MRYRLFAGSFIAFVAGVAAPTTAQSVTAFTYQGQLKYGGMPLNQTADFRFRLYDASNLGNQVGPEVPRSNVQVANGAVSEAIDFGASSFQSASSGRWLEIDIRSPAGSGNFVRLVPRQPLTPTPFALSTRGLDVDVSGNVGIGTASSSARLDINGLAKMTAFQLPTGAAPGMVLTSDAAGGGTWAPPPCITLPCVSATNNAACALSITNSGTGSAICGTSTPTSGNVYAITGTAASSSGSGVYGISSSTAGGSGVWGQANSATGAGLLGSNNAATGAAIGVHGYSISGTGNAVVGTSTAPTGACRGVLGETTSSSGTGVFGDATASSGSAYGVYGRSASNVGVGVYGYSPLSTGTIGVSDGTGGIGVYGGANAISGTTYAIYGSTVSSTGYAGYFLGGYGVFASSVYATSANSSIKAFKIDHPLDPANKYLQHSSVESPDMMNMYNGNVTTDAQGEAWVTLPAYFDALNRDFRYQLTVLDDTEFALARVAHRIEGHRFQIKTNRPGVEVSWQVTGIRQDAAANYYRIQVEQDKRAEDRGKYLVPEAFGQPADKAVHARPPLASSVVAGSTATNQEAAR